MINFVPIIPSFNIIYNIKYSNLKYTYMQFINMCIHKQHLIQTHTCLPNYNEYITNLKMNSIQDEY